MTEKSKGREGEFEEMREKIIMIERKEKRESVREKETIQRKR